MNSISIAARVRSEISWKEESSFVQFRISFFEGSYDCLLHESKLKLNSRIKKGSIIQIYGSILGSNELLIYYYVIIPEDNKKKFFN